MLVRLILVVLLALGGLFAWRKLRPHPLARVPRHWQRLAARNHLFRQALELRQGIVKALLKDAQGDAKWMSYDVDHALGQMARLIELQEQRGADPATEGEIAADLERGLNALRETRAAIAAASKAEVVRALEATRARLREHNENLEVMADARREVEGMVDD